MSSQPPETETLDVDLTRAERWAVHHALVTRADEAIESGASPPTWLVALVETIEAGGETVTRRQAGKLADLLTDQVATETTPERDVDHALDVVDRLDAAF